MDIAIDEGGKKGTCDLCCAMRQGSALRLESMLMVLRAAVLLLCLDSSQWCFRYLYGHEYKNGSVLYTNIITVSMFQSKAT